MLVEDHLRPAAVAAGTPVSVAVPLPSCLVSTICATRWRASSLVKARTRRRFGPCFATQTSQPRWVSMPTPIANPEGRAGHYADSLFRVI